MGTLERQLAEFVVGTDTSVLPYESLATAEVAILDTVGCALSAVSEPLGRIVTKFVEGMAARPEAAILGTAVRTSATEAALANGAMAHGLDLDDFDRIGHMSSIIVPALLACGESAHSSGEDVLAAYAMSAEVLGNLSAGNKKVKGFIGVHNTAVFGVLSATAGVARLSGLDPGQLVTAFGIAASMPSGVPANFGTFTAALHAGQAARAALAAVRLAQAGWTASPDAISGPTGWADVYLASGGFDQARAIADLGKIWHSEKPRGIRRYPCCLSNTSAIDSVLNLRSEHGFAAEDVTSITIDGFPPNSNVLRFGVPRDAFSGKFSVRHCVTVAMLDGAVTQDSFKPAVVERSEYRSLIEKVRTGVASDWEPPGPGNPVTVRLADGRTLTKTSPTALSPNYVHMTPAEVDQKFTTSAARALGEAGARRALEAWKSLRGMGDVADAIHAATISG